jgi:hypothetical protein
MNDSILRQISLNCCAAGTRTSLRNRLWTASTLRCETRDRRIR